MKIKLLIAATAATAMLAMTTFSASATTTSDIINELQAEGVSATQIAQIQDFFKSNTNFTSAQLDTVATNLDKVAAIFKANNTTDLSKLPDSAKDQIKTIITDTASAVGLSVTIGKDASGTDVLTVKNDGTSYTFSGTDSTPKTTGSDMAPYAVLAAGMMFMVGSAVYMASRRGKKTVA